MFSRTERAFLEALADGSPERMIARFPSHGYRRKLMWGIRQKAARSFADWELYTSAARHETRLLPDRRGRDPTEPPLFSDPIVAAWERLRARWRRSKEPGRSPDAHAATGRR